MQGVVSGEEARASGQSWTKALAGAPDPVGHPDLHDWWDPCITNVKSGVATVNEVCGCLKVKMFLQSASQ